MVAISILVGELGESENVVDYVNDAIANIDIDNKLTKYAKTEDVNQQIQSINDNLNNNYFFSHHFLALMNISIQGVISWSRNEAG